MSLLSKALSGSYIPLLHSEPATQLLSALTTRLTIDFSISPSLLASPLHSLSIPNVLAIGIAALNVFLQANVTGPVLEDPDAVEALFSGIPARSISEYLTVDGVAPYQFAPLLGLCVLASFAIGEVIPQLRTVETKDVILVGDARDKVSLSWWTMRVLVWQYKLLAQPNLGSRSGFARTAQWTEVPELLQKVTEAIDAVTNEVLGGNSGVVEWERSDKAELMVEIANSWLMLGIDDKARLALKEATRLSGLKYVLSGALGRKTKFQVNNTSQLVVLAKSAEGVVVADGENLVETRPPALKLNNDTLLEEIEFSRTAGAEEDTELAQDEDGTAHTKKKSQDQQGKPALSDATAKELAQLQPDQQPQLTALDEAILLTDATIRDTFSPQDGLTSEEVLPYAVRVINDKSVNWQVYTQALLVRSRIEVHRSRTMERGILQMQALVDQIVVETQSAPQNKKENKDRTQNKKDESEIPVIAVNNKPEGLAALATNKPTSFFPAIKTEESAPAHVRLRYVNSLLTPPRWHLESELAYCWASVGSLISAMDIFKRLHMWAEVALCLSSADRSSDEDGRGSGGDYKARGIVRWRLFDRTDGNKAYVPRDVTQLNPNEFLGPVKDADRLPPDAPRLFCMLGDLEHSAAHYEMAWAVSKGRYSPAMRNLGEHYIQNKDLQAAREAYQKAVHANRLSPELWGRLGDLHLRLADYNKAAEAYTYAIGAANDNVGGEDARIWSNLGSALWSLYEEAIAKIAAKENPEAHQATTLAADNDEEDDEEQGDVLVVSDKEYSDAGKLLQQALNAFKQGSKLSRDNWRIWENIITIGSRMRPPVLMDIVTALQRIATIRADESAVDGTIVRLLVDDGLLAKKYTGEFIDGLYMLPRGSVEKAVYELLEKDIVPLISFRDDLWALVSRARVWRHDYAGAIEAAESAWRAATGTASAGSLAVAGSTKTAQRADWTKDDKAWDVVVQRTDELVSLLENYGDGVKTIGSKWKFRARNAVRSVMGKGRERWEETEGWRTLDRLMGGLKGTAS